VKCSHGRLAPAHEHPCCWDPELHNMKFRF